MFFYKIMPVLDIFSAIAVLFGPYLPLDVVRIAGTYLIGKGLFFVLISKDIPSFIDLVIGVYAISIAYLHFYNILISLLALLFIGQKSLLALGAA